MAWYGVAALPIIFVVLLARQIIECSQIGAPGRVISGARLTIFGGKSSRRAKELEAEVERLQRDLMQSLLIRKEEAQIDKQASEILDQMNEQMRLEMKGRMRRDRVTQATTAKKVTKAN